MRKILITIVIILLGILSYRLVIDGAEFGKFKIDSISSIQTLSDNLDKKIDEATQATTVTFNNATNSLNNALKKLSNEKAKYEQKVKNMTEEEIRQISQKQIYEIETIWVKLGKYAKQNDVILKLDITTGNTGDPRDKELRFTVTGSYIGITDFVYDLEDDEKLQFKIENFKLVPEGSLLKATFVVRDVAINLNTTTTTSNTTNDEVTEQ